MGGHKPTVGVCVVVGVPSRLDLNGGSSVFIVGVDPHVDGLLIAMTVKASLRVVRAKVYCVVFLKVRSVSTCVYGTRTGFPSTRCCDVVELRPIALLNNRQHIGVEVLELAAFKKTCACLSISGLGLAKGVLTPFLAPQPRRAFNLAPAGPFYRVTTPKAALVVPRVEEVVLPDRVGLGLRYNLRLGRCAVRIGVGVRKVVMLVIEVLSGPTRIEVLGSDGPRVEVSAP